MAQMIGHESVHSVRADLVKSQCSENPEEEIQVKYYLISHIRRPLLRHICSIKILTRKVLALTSLGITSFARTEKVFFYERYVRRYQYFDN